MDSEQLREQWMKYVEITQDAGSSEVMLPVHLTASILVVMIYHELTDLYL